LEAKFGNVEERIKTINMGMEFFRRTYGYAFLGHKINKEILEELEAEQFDEKL
jgi:hypothetical protein